MKWIFLFLVFAFTVSNNLFSNDSIDEEKFIEFSKQLEWAQILISDVRPRKYVFPDKINYLYQIPKPVTEEEYSVNKTILRNSFYFENSPFHSDRIEFQCDISSLLKTRYYISFFWTEALTADHKNIINKKKHSDFTNWKQVAFLGNFIDNEVFVTPDDRDDVISLKGQFEVYYPMDYVNTVLSQKDIGKIYRIGDLEFKLLTIENDFTAIWTNDYQDHIYIDMFGLNVNGKVLDIKGTGSHLYKLYTLLKEKEKLSQKQLIKLYKGYEEIGKYGHIIYLKVNGSIDKTLVSVAKDFKQEVFEVEALRSPDKESKSIAVNRERLKKSYFPQFIDIPEKDLISKISAYPDRSRALANLNELDLIIRLPEIDNSLYDRSEFEDVKYYKDNRILNGYSPDDFDRATGLIEIYYPQKITTVVYDIDNFTGSDKIRILNQNEIEIIDKATLDLWIQSTYSAWSLGSISSSPFVSIRAYNNDGISLVYERSLLNHPVSKKDEHIAKFMGTIKRIELDIVDKWIRTTKQFDIEAGPKIDPKDGG